MRTGCTLLLLALTACSTEPPSGPTPVAPPSTAPAPQPTPLPQTRPLPFEGAYELSISVAPECQRAFPVAARIRRYDVMLFSLQDHSEIDFLDLSVADSIGDGPGYSSLAILSREGEAKLTLRFAALLSYSQAGHPVYLWIDARSWDGDAYVPIRGDALEGRLSGQFLYDAGPDSTQCTSDGHNFYLRPR